TGVGEAGRVRVHRTTREQPAARLVVEQGKLIPLPRQRFEAGVVVTRLIGDDFCVPYETNRYSVPPHYAGHTVKVRVLEGRLEVELNREVSAAAPVGGRTYQRLWGTAHDAHFPAPRT